ncbi:MAG TPA: sugar phosphate isomerase/epimerase family protein [Dongiaceae bacterium]|jgi:sugar phosphate isomerase/epimerase|nr:sugar phosphate isomerase/epimerase family protein [Dongiaceae bacterium]
MRLGCTFFAPQSAAELGALVDKLDTYGVSAVWAPRNLAEIPQEQCDALGEAARSADLVIGEALFAGNLLTEDKELRAQRIKAARALLLKADRMGCRSVFTLIGTRDKSDRILAPHPYLFTDDCIAETRDNMLRILDGLELRQTKLGLEPWFTSFFYQPEDMLAFVESVGHPNLGVHLDVVNMTSHASFYRTGDLVERAFRLLSKHVVSVHLKDIAWDGGHMGLRWNEVYIGDGSFDVATYLRHAGTLPADMTCYCEHLPEERDYAVNFARLHHLAARNGQAFKRRGMAN